MWTCYHHETKIDNIFPRDESNASVLFLPPPGCIVNYTTLGAVSPGLAKCDYNVQVCLFIRFMTSGPARPTLDSRRGNKSTTSLYRTCLEWTLHCLTGRIDRSVTTHRISCRHGNVQKGREAAILDSPQTGHQQLREEETVALRAGEVCPEKETVADWENIVW